jgi:hypothetical protein
VKPGNHTVVIEINKKCSMNIEDDREYCHPKSRLAGTLFCGGVNDAREIEGNPKLQEAFDLGKSIG